MTTLALGRRALAAHPPWPQTLNMTCASTHVRAHVHVVGDDRAHFHMPDGCAACGREWFAEDEITYMGYCGDCWPGNAMLWDWSDGVEVVAATYPQPVRHRAQPVQGRATVGGEPVGIFTTSIDWCHQCGWLYGRHAPHCYLTRV